MSASAETNTPGPGRRYFEDPVHDWAAMAATLEPDWAHLRTLAGEFTIRPERETLGLPASDWDYLRHVAGNHQLMGVVVWRLLDERFSDLLPGDRYHTELVQMDERRDAGGRECM